MVRKSKLTLISILVNQRIMTKFEIDENLKGYIMKSLGKKWRDHKSCLKAKHYDSYADDGIQMPHCPSNVLNKQWKTFVHYWRSKDGKRISAKNKEIQKQQILPHTSGSKSFGRVRNEERMKSEMQARPGPVDMFIKTHLRKDGKLINTEA